MYRIETAIIKSGVAITHDDFQGAGCRVQTTIVGEE